MPAVPIARGIEIQFGLRLQQIFQDARAASAHPEM
jgi:hypothetical protein